MYSLLMSGADRFWSKGVANWDLGRYLEYTSDALKERMKSMTDSVINELMSLPTLFAYELPGSEPARVGWITAIQRRQREARIEFTFDPDIPPVSSSQMEMMLVELDIDPKLEKHRSHWAIKEVDLIAVLRRFNIANVEHLVDSSTFVFSRQTIIKACNLLRRNGHANFDQILLDIGLNHIDAGRNRGGLQARSVALGSYVVDHAEERTAEGELLSYAVIRRAAESDPTYTEADEPTDPLRSEFWTSLKRDGYAFENMKIIPIAADRAPITAVTRPYALINRPMPQQSAVIASKPTVPGRLTGKPQVTAEPKVFIVHGRESAPKLDVARFLERAGIEPVILHERPNGGRTLIAKFQEESADIVFAIVLMTPDDTGGLAGETTRPRARQNVIFELGFFIGKLGASKVCALVQGNIEKPSDFDAVVYIQYGESGGWKNELARELKHAGIPFNPDALL